MSALLELAGRWRQEAEVLRGYGSDGAAAAAERHAAELEAAVRADADELLPPEAAAAESGLSTRRLAQLRASGALPNHGTPARPLYRSADLPRKARKAVAGGYDPAADAAALLRRATSPRGAHA